MESPRSTLSGQCNLNLQRLLAELKETSLENCLSKAMPASFMQLFEQKFAIDLREKSQVRIRIICMRCD